ncbi:MAG: methionine gamma-lyase family protein [Clostridia bacterium]|nr:methionine gamma-lyase family protein [Clostridia bacterium]
MAYVDSGINLIEEAEKEYSHIYKRIDEIAYYNQKKVLEAFRKNRIAERHLKGSSGYGYGDIGRDSLCHVYADVFKTEAALVSPLIANGTHALTIGLFALLRSGEALYSVTGEPYDTLMGVINGESGSLKEYGIGYYQSDLNGSGGFKFDEIIDTINTHSEIKVVYVTRSRGYTSRKALKVTDLGALIAYVKERVDRKLYFVVDNCYGEFTQENEPSEFGADLTIGSLIKNIGGGLAPTGGYLVGTVEAVEKAAFRLTAPGLGNEVGSYMYGYQNYYEGLFLAPHIVANALKGSVLIGAVMKKCGYHPIPEPEEEMNDIIRSIVFNDENDLIKFIQTIQKYSPIDSDVLPEPWDMPGYNEKVIMAAGSFVGGASIELSADAPIKPPYIAYVQGGLTYEHVKIALEGILSELKK